MTEDIHCDDAIAIEKLIQSACQEVNDDDSDWHSVQQLRRCGNRLVFERMYQLLQTGNSLERSLAAAVLGQFGPIIHNEGKLPELERRFKEESGEALLMALGTEQDEVVLNSLIVGLGHLADIRALEKLITFATHSSNEIRYSVVHGLMSLNSEQATTTLLILMHDEDADVRNWATFAIGTIREEEDSPSIRNALFVNCDDADEDTRFEALAGLALRRDQRIITRILDETEPEDKLLLSHVWDALLAMLHEMKDDIEDERLDPLLYSFPTHYSQKDI